VTHELLRAGTASAGGDSDSKEHLQIWKLDRYREMDHIAAGLRGVTIYPNEIGLRLLRWSALDEVQDMTEPEILLPVKCPICLQESLTGFRFSIVATALATGSLRLYANCHVASWDAGESELEQIREFLDATWSESQNDFAEYSIDALLNDDDLAFTYTELMDNDESDEDFHDGSASR